MLLNTRTIDRITAVLIAIAIATLLTVLVSVGTAKAQQTTPSNCYPYDKAVKNLAQNYSEYRVFVAPANAGGVIEVYASRGGKTWTMFLSSHGKLCYMTSGRDWSLYESPELFGPAPSKTKSPIEEDKA